MYEACGILFLFLEQPMHPGSGTSVEGVDLPIQREVHTQYPMIQSAGVKGALKDAVQNRRLLDDSEVNWLFGVEGQANLEASAIAITDARVLLFPVKSALGVFGWTTTSHVLGRLATDFRAAQLATSSPSAPGSGADPAETLPTDAQRGADDLVEVVDRLNRLSLAPDANAKAEKALWPATCPLELNKRVVLEERVFEGLDAGGDAQPAPAGDKNTKDPHQEDFDTLTGFLGQTAVPASPGYWSEEVQKRTVIVPPNAFRDFVKYSIQLETHIKLGDDGIVELGPWDEELIPSETVMYCVVGFQGFRGSADRTAAQALKLFTEKVSSRLSHVQIGGDATLGKGIASLRFHPIDGLFASFLPTSSESEAETEAGS